MTHSSSNSRSGLKRRHHRIDSDLQARARPFSLVRKDAAKSIREFVENFADDQSQFLEKRLLPPVGGGSGGGNDGGSGTKNNGGSGTSTGSGSSDPFPVEGGGGDNGGDNGGSGSNTGGGNSGTKGNSGGDSTTKASSNTKTPTSPTTTKGGLLSSLFSHTPTTTSTTPTSTSISTTPTSTSISTTATSTYSPSTSIAYVTPSSVPTLNNAVSSPTQSSSSSSSPGAGLIIGIVAGALAGVAVLAAVIGFLFKKFGKKEDPYEADPFDSDEFRRQSAMLPDTFDDIDHNPEMSEVHHGGMGQYGDEMEYAAMGAAGAGAASAFTARNDSGGPRPPTMFQKHMNAPAAQISVGDSPPVPVIGAIYNTNGMDPTPQLPPMAFGGSDPYSMAGVGRPNFENNLNNPYGYLDRQYSANRSSPQQDKYVDAAQGYSSLDRPGSNESMNEKGNGMEDYTSYSQHNTSGRPGTAEGRSGTPDLPNLQQTYAIGENDGRVQSPDRMVTSPEHMSQDYLTNGMPQQFMDHNSHYQQPPQYADSNSPPNKPLQVRNLLPNPYVAAQQNGQGRPVSGVSSVADDEAAYGGVW